MTSVGIETINEEDSARLNFQARLWIKDERAF